MDVSLRHVFVWIHGKKILEERKRDWLSITSVKVARKSECKQFN